MGLFPTYGGMPFKLTPAGDDVNVGRVVGLTRHAGIELFVRCTAWWRLPG